MPEMSDHETHREEHADWLREAIDWPAYYASGLDVDVEDFVPAYFRVKGPTGPVDYVNPDSGPWPMTMYDFAMEAQSKDFRPVPREETPWPEFEDEDLNAASNQGGGEGR